MWRETCNWFSWRYKMHRNVKDLNGQRFNKLTILRRHGSSRQGRARWKCKCDCGEETVVIGYDLTSGNTKSCGCNKAISSRVNGQIYKKDISGKRVGRLTAVNPTNLRTHGEVVWGCSCDCGEMTLVNVGALVGGKIKSCGCLSDASQFAKNTDINSNDVPFAVTNVIKTRRELKKAIKQAS